MKLKLHTYSKAHNMMTYVWSARAANLGKYSPNRINDAKGCRYLLLQTFPSHAIPLFRCLIDFMINDSSDYTYCSTHFLLFQVFLLLWYQELCLKKNQVPNFLNLHLVVILTAILVDRRCIGKRNNFEMFKLILITI